MRVTYLLIATALVAYAPPAAADVLCKTRKGAMMVRASCKRRETQLDPGALGIARGPDGPEGPRGANGSAGPTGPQGAPGVGLVVKDANGAAVGAVVGMSGEEVEVARRMGNQSVRFDVRTTGFSPSGPQLRFPTTDCSGQGFAPFPANLDPPLPLALIQPSDKVGVHPSGTPVNVTVNSYAHAVDAVTDCTNAGGTILGSPPGWCCEATGPSMMTLSPATVDNFGALNLVPPFHIEGP